MPAAEHKGSLILSMRRRTCKLLQPRAPESRLVTLASHLPKTPEPEPHAMHDWFESQGKDRGLLRSKHMDMSEQGQKVMHCGKVLRSRPPAATLPGPAGDY